MYDAGVVDKALSKVRLVNASPSLKRLLDVGLLSGFWLEDVFERSSTEGRFDVATL